MGDPHESSQERALRNGRKESMERRKAIFVLIFAFTLVCSTVSANAQPLQTKKYIAFRDDDVQPFKWLDALEAVNQVHIEENVPVTLGIIPHPVTVSGN